MNNFKLLLISLAAIALSLSACKKDDPEPPNEEEVITTLNYTLTPQSGDAVTLTFQDLDGDGGNAPTVTSGTLSANTIYSGSLELLNEIENEDITEEIKDEDDEHQFFFEATNGISIDYDDEDGDGNPVGLSNTLTTTSAGSGTIKVTLIHEPEKDADGVAGGSITNAGGETDIEVTFNVTVQ